LKTGSDDEIGDSFEYHFLNDRDITVLHVIEEERLTSFSFDGLKRRLGTHSETLSRILDRLEAQSVLEKAHEGYRITSKGRELLDLHPLNAKESRVTLLRTLLPRDVDYQQIIFDLKGKWFGALRWFGHSVNEDEVVLKWITDDGRIQVDAKFSAGELNIDGKLLKGKDLADAIRASYQLVGYISRMYSRVRPIKRVAYLEIFYPFVQPN
jgi:DNA-binding MarR family transcriptional regulator